MMSNSPEYFRPASVKECLQILQEYDERCRILAGGTDLIIDLEESQFSNHHIIDLGKIQELGSIKDCGDGIRMGSMVTYDEIEHSLLLQSHASVLVSAASEVGSPQIRHQGTLGGNLSTASPAGDAIPALYVVSAVIVLASANGNRTVPIHEFFTSVRETIRQPDELLLEIIIPKETGKFFSFFRKVGQRKAQTIAKASVAFHGKVNDCILEKVKIAMGSVASTVIFAPKTQEFLNGQKLTQDLISKAADLIKTEVNPIDDIRSTAWYRQEVVGGILIEELTKYL